MRYSMILVIPVLLLISVAAISCKNQKLHNPTSTQDSVSRRNSSDWAGFYHGKISGTDGKDINLTLVLKENSTYLYQWRHEGRNDEYFQQKGSFSWNNKGSIIKLQMKGNPASLPDEYTVEDSFLRPRGWKKKDVEGAIQGKYMLVKTPHELSEKQWVLTELKGQPVPGDKNLNKTPLLNINGYNGVISGNGGCNIISGTFRLSPPDKITFQNIATTKMLCPEMEVEKNLLDVLHKTQRYKITGDTLLLLHESNSTLAGFISLKNETRDEDHLRRE